MNARSVKLERYREYARSMFLRLNFNGRPHMTSDSPRKIKASLSGELFSEQPVETARLIYARDGKTNER